MKHILLTTDFSPEAETAFPVVQEALKLFGTDNARCTVLAVVEDISEKGTKFQLAKAMLDRHGISEDNSSKTKTDLEALVAKYFTDFDAKSVVINTGRDASSEILEFARQEGVGLIVMATHGRTGVSQMILGSVTERVIKDSPCPVVVVPTK